MKRKLFLWAMLICMSAIGNAQNITIANVSFKEALLDHDPVIDTNQDGEISKTEAELVTSIDINYKSISSINGIEHFVNLESLSAYKNRLSSVDLSSNVNLIELNLGNNFLNSINLAENTKLQFLHLSYNSFSNIDISNNTELLAFNMFSTGLTSIDVSKNINLLSLSLLDNELTEIDLSSNLVLSSLLLNDNKLTEIDLTLNTNLAFLSIENNNLTQIDLSKNVRLQQIKIQGNLIETLDVRSSSSVDEIYFSNNPNLTSVFMTGQPLKIFGGDLNTGVQLGNCPQLEFICVDEKYIDLTYDLLIDAGQDSCEVTTDCSAYDDNRIQGFITYDLDGDGCDSDDVPFTQNITISANSLTGGSSIVAYPNDEGRYTLFVPNGTYNFLPFLDTAGDTNYFKFSTAPVFNITNIPDDLDTLVVDYCIQPLGDFNDLEVSILPSTRAVAGFSGDYVIVYTNNGTTTQSGSLTLDYEDDVLTYVSSNPSENSNINGQLTWSFDNLQPMETVEIPLSFLLNAPTDSPALNLGDILNYTVSIAGATDENPDNNIMELAQIVANSYDPNDKTCLEGNVLDPDDVGNYLHYVIRFENEGTAEAVNIRVTDNIDITKFDIASFVPLKSSHSYSTTITDGKDIEFTFSDINLPFDDENNDGYVYFKIKTLDTLVEGDEIINSAAIYFDFNFPIITEDSVVKVEREPTCEVINFVDLNFKNALLNHTNPVIDTNGDGEVCVAEAEAVTDLSIDNENISDLSGINYFINLETLDADNNNLTAIDVSYNTALQNLRIQTNNLTDIDVTNNLELNILNLHQNDLTAIDVSNNILLKTLALSENNLTTIDISNNYNLTYLGINDNLLTAINVSNNLELKKLYVIDNNLTNIDVSNLLLLQKLSLGGNNLSDIDVTNNTQLTELRIQNNDLTSIDLTNQTILTLLTIAYNKLTTLDVSSCALTSLSFPYNSNLQTVFISKQPIEYNSGVLKLYLNYCPALEFICANEEYVDAINDLLDEASLLDAQVSSDCDTIQEAVFSDLFTLSPNPTTGIINLGVLDENSVLISNIFIYDSGANLVDSYPGTTRTMDLSNLNVGLYYLTTNTNLGNFTSTFIKN